jgi:hypothetical protein
MWLATIDGFYSAVCKDPKNRPDVITVRARAEKDLEVFVQHYLPIGVTPKIHFTPERDYQYRIEISRVDWSFAMTEISLTVTYDNFKSAVGKVDKVRASIYGALWSILTEISPLRPYSAARWTEPVNEGPKQGKKKNRYVDAGQFFPRFWNRCDVCGNYTSKCVCPKSSEKKID